MGVHASAAARINRTAARLIACSLEDLNSLTPAQFEHVAAEVLRSKGNSVEEVGGEADGGIDLIVTNPHLAVSYAQCKRWKRKVGVDEIRSFVGALVENGSERTGLFITTSTYTDDARTAGGFHNLDLIDGARLLGMISPNVADQVKEILEANDAIGVPLCPFCGELMVRRVAKKGRDAGLSFWGCSTFSKSRCRGRRA